MEVRTRSSNPTPSGWVNKDDDHIQHYEQHYSKGKVKEDLVRYNPGSGPTIRQRIRREIWELTRVMTNLLQGRGSKVTYLLIPTMISLFWVLICLLTTRQPSISLEERLSQQHYRVGKLLRKIIVFIKFLIKN